MQAGDLKERILVQRRASTADAQGGRATTWVDLVTGSATVTTPLPASVEPVSTSEGLDSNTAIVSVQAYTVRLRYRGDITAAMRVLWTPYRAAAALVLEIRGIRFAGRQWLQLDCAVAL